ncbi:MAG: hypothetical protein ACRCW4_14200 [Candidatus Neomicrothrix subdominans]
MIDEPNSEGRLLNANEELIRIWIPDTRWSNRSWSPMLGEQFLTMCRDWLCLQELANLLTSDVLQAGILTIPSGVLAAIGATLQNPNGTPVENGQVLAMFAAQFEDARDGGSVADRMIPVMMTGTADDLAAVGHVQVKPRMGFAEVQDKLRYYQEYAASVLLTPTVLISGFSEHKYANGAIEAGTADTVSWGPLADTIADYITAGHMHPWLRRLGVTDVTRYQLHGNTAALARRPPTFSDVLDARRQGVIGGAAARDLLGIPESSAPTDVDFDEMQRLISINKEDTRPGEDLGLVSVKAGSLTPPSAIIAARALPPDPYARLTQAVAVVTSRTTTRVASILDQAGAAALRDLGARVKRQAREKQPWKDAIQASASPEVALGYRHPAHGPALAALVDRAVADDLIRDRVMAARADIEAELADGHESVWAAMIAARINPDAIKPRAETARREASTMLSLALLAMLGNRTARAYEAPDDDVTFGVPQLSAATIMTAVAVAGGARISDSVAATSPRVAFGGLAAEWVTTAASLGGVPLRRSWLWVHDHPRQPHPVHVALDGTFDPDGWFGGEYPGAHDGCLCLVQPVWTAAELERAA